MSDYTVGDGGRSSDVHGESTVASRRQLYRMASDPTRSPSARIRRLLEFTRERLGVENAIVHNPDPEPWVRVEAEQVGKRVRIHVHDDGPGIPEEQRTVLEEGRETPLSHGSGIGLWLTYWAVRTVGGEVRFRDRDPTGSTVTLVFPVAD